MAQSPFEYWEKSRELQMWQNLISRCTCEPPVGLSLPEIFDRVHETVKG